MKNRHSVQNQKLIDDKVIWFDTFINKWCRKCPICSTAIFHSCFDGCLSCYRHKNKCFRCKKHNKGTHTSSTQKMIDDGIIWKNDAGFWCKKCSGCGSSIEYNGEYSLDNCLRSFRRSVECYVCCKTGAKHPYWGTHHNAGSSHPRFGRHLLSEEKKNLSNKLRGRKILWVDKIVESNARNKFRRKEYFFPGGRRELVQGYEPWTIDYLLSLSVSPNDIKLKHHEKPIILYIWKGNEKRYYPDCYISSSNTLVETKSTWTWNSNFDQNNAKISASLNNGYDTRIIIWDYAGNLCSDKLYLHLNA